MIGRVLDAVRQRTAFADTMVEGDETLTVMIGDHETVWRQAGNRAHLRVENEGRLGLCTREDLQIEPMVESALLHARYGPPSALHPPAPSPLPDLLTSYPASASLGPQELLGLARLLRDRLQADGRQVETWAERSVSRVDVANTSGVMAGYDSTLAGVGAALQVETAAGPLFIRLHDAGLGLPDEAMVGELVAEVDWRLAAPLLDEAPGEATRLWFGPRAVAALLVPVCQALLAGRVWSDEGPFAGMVGERILSPLLTLTDDPLVPGRPGTGPVDDEGVVCRRITLVRQGVLCGALADLITASRLGIPATGHGRRSPGGPSWTGWSNLMVEPGPGSEHNAPALIEEGILVHDLPLPGGDCYNGRIAVATPWAYRVTGGEVVGRYDRLLLKGNAFEWLNRVERVGPRAKWIGSRCLPDLVIGDPR